MLTWQRGAEQPPDALDELQQTQCPQHAFHAHDLGHHGEHQRRHGTGAQPLRQAHRQQPRVAGQSAQRQRHQEQAKQHRPHAQHVHQPQAAQVRHPAREHAAHDVRHAGRGDDEGRLVLWEAAVAAVRH